MTIGKTLYVTTRAMWRQWLTRHHNSEKEIWLVMYKKHAQKPSVAYNDAVEEALCFGWIDSILKSLDADRTAQRFSPRREGSNLSESNRERALRLIRAGAMTPAGLSKIQKQLETRSRNLSG